MSVYSLSDTISYVTQVKETLRKLFESILFIYQSICLLYSFGVLRCNIELEETVNRSLTMRLQRDSVKWENAVDDMTAAVRRIETEVCTSWFKPAVEQWISSLNTCSGATFTGTSSYLWLRRRKLCGNRLRLFYLFTKVYVYYIVLVFWEVIYIELEESVNRSLTMWLQRDSVKWENAVDDMTAAVRRMRLKFVCHAGLRPAVEQWISSLNTAVQHSLSENWNVSSMCDFFEQLPLHH